MFFISFQALITFLSFQDCSSLFDCHVLSPCLLSAVWFFYCGWGEMFFTLLFHCHAFSVVGFFYCDWECFSCSFIPLMYLSCGSVCLLVWTSQYRLGDEMLRVMNRLDFISRGCLCSLNEPVSTDWWCLSSIIVHLWHRLDAISCSFALV